MNNKKLSTLESVNAIKKLGHENKMFKDFFKELGLDPLTINDLIINGSNDEWKNQMNHKFHYWKFDTAFEGMEILKEYYKKSGGENTDDFFDYYAKNHSFYFHPDVPINLRFEAIQLVRTYYFKKDSIESKCITERVDDEKDMFMNFCYLDNTPVPKGIRVGLMVFNKKLEMDVLRRDYGILFN